MIVRQWKALPWTQILLALILLYQVLNHSVLAHIENDLETQSVIHNMTRKDVEGQLNQLSSDVQDVTKAVEATQ